MKITALFASLILALPCSADAAYDLPPRNYGLNFITSVVDATVTGYDDRGHARIHLHHILVGNGPPSKLVGAIYTCMDSTPRAYKVQERQRYVFLLVGNRMFEEQSFFPVSVNEEGTVSVHLGSYSQWLGLPHEPISLMALKHFLQEESEKAKANKTIRAKALADVERMKYFYEHQQEYRDSLRRKR